MTSFSFVSNLVSNYRKSSKIREILRSKFLKTKKPREPLFHKDSRGIFMELVTRFELVTSSLPRPKLHYHTSYFTRVLPL